MKSQITTFYIMRHGESADNVRLNSGIQTVSTDEFGSSLTEKGKQQVRQTAKILQDVQFDAIFSSDLARAWESAEIIAQERNMGVTQVSFIRERDFGIYNTRFIDHREEARPLLAALSDEEKMTFKLHPSVESWEEVGIRLRNFVTEKAEEYPGKTILVVCHGNMMRAFLVLLGKAKVSQLPSGSVKNAAFLKVTTDGDEFETGEMHGIYLSTSINKA